MTAENQRAPFDPTIYLKSPSISDRTASLISQIRFELRNDQLYLQYETWCTDETIHRFLISKQFHIPGTIEKLLTALRWRITRIPPKGGIESLPNWDMMMGKEGETGKVYIPGYDRWGRPVICLDNSVQNTDSPDGQLNFLAWNLETACKMMPPEVDKFVAFMRLENFSLFNNPALETTRETIFMLKDAYPERMGHCILYLPPGFFEMLYQALKVFLDPRTDAKLVFIYGDVSDGSENDKKLRMLIGDHWKSLTGSNEPVYKYGCARGYNHATFWPMALDRANFLNTKSEKEPNQLQEAARDTGHDNGRGDTRIDCDDGSALDDCPSDDLSDEADDESPSVDDADEALNDDPAVAYEDGSESGKHPEDDLDDVDDTDDLDSIFSSVYTAVNGAQEAGANCQMLSKISADATNVSRRSKEKSSQKILRSLDFDRTETDQESREKPTPRKHLERGDHLELKSSKKSRSKASLAGDRAALPSGQKAHTHAASGGGQQRKTRVMNDAITQPGEESVSRATVKAAAGGGRVDDMVDFKVPTRAGNGMPYSSMGYGTEFNSRNGMTYNSMGYGTEFNSRNAMDYHATADFGEEVTPISGQGENAEGLDWIWRFVCFQGSSSL